MDTDRNLLFGVIALQADLLDSAQFAEGCAAWAARKNIALADLLVERGWLTREDRERVDWLLERKLKKHGGDASASLAAAITPEAHRVLAHWNDPAIQSSLAKLSQEPNAALLSAPTVAPITRDRYTLTTLHAKGGIGQVWRAHDAQLGRDIALKELQPERAGDARLRRYFITEAQVTGQLEHPGIVPVYELMQPAGDGLPFYTMRFVQGRTLRAATRVYHEKRKAGKAGPLDLRELLDAFVKVCQTVAYAHARGVIHRDLKGQNIVLGDFGEVIVLDWGFAKVLGQAEQELASPPVVVPAKAGANGTMAGEVIGTPAYMAPEQAEGRLDRIDGRTDVYGLGAILYEILTDQPPFRGADQQEVLRRVREEQPARPRSLGANVSPALEAVCLKALAKQSNERYPSATELARDVQRWLADEPVSAYREPWLTRLGRWSRRHRTAVASMGVGLAAAVVFLAVLAVVIDQGRRRSIAEQHHTEEALQMLGALASKHNNLANLLQTGSQLKESEVAYHEVLAIQEQLAARFPNEPQYRLELARSHHNLAHLLETTGRREEAARSYQKAIAIKTQLAADFPGEPQYRQSLAVTHHSLGNLLVDAGQLQEAEKEYQNALTIQKELVAQYPKDPNAPLYRKNLAESLNSLGTLLQATGRPEEATKAYQDALAMKKQLAAEFPDVPEYRENLALSHLNLGVLLEATRRLQDAGQEYQDALALFQRLARESPDVSDYQENLAKTMINMAILANDNNQFAQARELLGQAETHLRTAQKANPKNPHYRQLFRINRQILTTTLAGLGDHAGALKAAEELSQSGTNSAADTYDVACALALCVPLAEKDANLAESQRRQQAQAYADRAMTMLRQAVAKGYADADHMKQDTDLDSLRQRADFQKLLAEVEATKGKHP
jgi:serine/threonine-protein kinase